MLSGQAGASITDWMLSAVSLAGAWKLHQHPGQHPRWYSAFVWAYLSEGLSCFMGGFMWGSGTNVMPSPLPPLHAAVAGGMIIGMAGEALALILAFRLLKGTEVDGLGPVTFWAACTKAVFVFVVFYVYVGWWCNVGVSWLLLPCMLLGIAFPLMMEPGIKHSQGNSLDSAVQSWRLILCGNVLNLTGAIVLGALDGDCTGSYCFGEPLPLLPKPCPFVLAKPPGSSCPLPLWFNHGAVMHVFAMAACVVSTRGLAGLLDCNWTPPGGKDADKAQGKCHSQ
mmetsp:Transcript_40924/g.73976  ORF Transcript_40924/g.73976 Transcript_40924/m.73976 type:complete len:281 (-) Transcript_40924:150-992(-)